MTKLVPRSKSKAALTTLEEAVMSTNLKTVKYHIGSVLDQRIAIKAATRRTLSILSETAQLTAARSSRTTYLELVSYLISTFFHADHSH